MPLIKSANAPASLSTFSMADIETHARSILMRASQQAEQLLAAAQAEADLMREQAKTEAYAEGLAAGKRDGVAQGKSEGAIAGEKAAFEAEKAKFDAAVEMLAAMTTAFEAERQAVIDTAQAEIMPLALAIARKVTRRMGEVDPGVVDANLRECLRLLSGSHDVRIHVNADQMAIAEELLPRIEQQFPTLKHVSFHADDTIVPGGCRVNTAGGEIDADLNHQLDRLIDELVGVAGA